MSSVVTLSDDQAEAVRLIDQEFRGGGYEFVLAGLAGTGKTTIIRYICDRFANHRIAIAAPTGKAAQVLTSKLGGYKADTIHALLYRPIGEIEDEETGEVELAFKERPHNEFRADLLIIDEASMVGVKMYREISARMVPTLWVGDHGQLPPVKSQDPGLMSRPDYALERIHRQAAGNPIIDLAHHVRGGGWIGDRFDGVDRLLAKNVSGIAVEYLARGLDILIVSQNRIRMAINAAIRQRLGRQGSALVPGDRIICLMNNRALGIFNGELFHVVRIVNETSAHIIARVCSETGRELTVRMLKAQLNSESTLSEEATVHTCLFTYGYAITCHKSQGSQWSNVGVLDREVRDPRRWYYTAVTRAAERLTVFLT